MSKCEEHKWEYKETIKTTFFVSGKPLEELLYAIFVCSKCGEVKKQEL